MTWRAPVQYASGPSVHVTLRLAPRDGAWSLCTLFYSYADAQKSRAMLTDSAAKDSAEAYTRPLFSST